MRVPFLAHKNRVILNFSNGVERFANSFATLLANRGVSKSVSIISGFQDSLTTTLISGSA